MGIKDGEESKINGIDQIFSKIIEESFPKLGKDIAIQIQEAHETQLNKTKRQTPCVFFHNQNIKYEEQRKILKAARE